MIARTPALFELIEAYLNGRMSDAERLKFEARIKENPDLEMEVEKHRILSEALQDEELLTFRKKVAMIATDFRQEQTNTTDLQAAANPRGAFWKVAATILVLLGLGVVLWWQINADKSTFDRYFEPYNVEDTMRGTEEDALTAVAKNYADGKYTEVIPRLVDLIEQHPENTEIQLYLANSYLQTDQASLAIALLKKIELGNARFEAARWYLALSYLKADDGAAAKAVIEKLIAYDGIYKAQAQAVLNELH